MMPLPPARPTKPEMPTKDELESRISRARAQGEINRKNSIKSFAERILVSRMSFQVVRILEPAMSRLIEESIKIATEFYDYEIQNK